MNSAAQLGGLFLSTGLIAASLTWVLIRYSALLHLTAAPAEDRWHKVATPSSGGIAILIACGAVYCFAYKGVLAPVAVGALILSLLGFVDDRVHLRPLVKLCAQAAVTLWMVQCGYLFPASSWRLLNAAFSFLWIIGITNAFNLIDNMDGLCAGVTVIIAFSRIGLLLSRGFTTDAGLLAIVAGGFAGFLIFNYKPAKIFMGDTGSMLAGFTLATLALTTPLAHTKIFAAELVYPALTFLYPIFDTTLVSFLRRIAGRPISVGGRDHSSHRLASLGLDERRVVWVLWLLTAAGGFAGLLIQWVPHVVIAAAAALTLLVTVFGIFLATLPAYPLPLGSTILGTSKVRKWVPSLRAAITIVVDMLIAGLALFIAFLLRWGSRLPHGQVHVFLYALPAIMLCHGAICLITKTYAVSWHSFDLGDAVKFVQTIAVSATLAYGIVAMLQIHFFARGALLLYVVLCFSMSVALRMSLRVFQEIFLKLIPDEGFRRVAIFGISKEAEVFARFLADYRPLKVTPVVFVDYDSPSAGMNICGIPVRCCRAGLVELASAFRLQAVVIPAGIAPDPMFPDLERDCSEAGLSLEFADVALIAETRRYLSTPKSHAPPQISG